MIRSVFCVHYHWISWDDFRRCTRRKSLTVQNACVRMPTSAACRLPRVRRRPCVFKNCQAESPKKIQIHKSWVQKFHPFKQTPVDFQEPHALQAPVFFQTVKPPLDHEVLLLWSSKKKQLGAIGQWHHARFFVDLCIPLPWQKGHNFLDWNFFSSFTSARLSLQTGFREKPVSNIRVMIYWIWISMDIFSLIHSFQRF